MNKNVGLLLIAQFLSAFADNAILFTSLALVMQSAELPTWYISALQGAFLVAFVVFAPWVGPYSDAHPKSSVLVYANGIKLFGTGLFFLQIEPLLAYATVGAGAALYSPAKYGILPELVKEQSLVKANGWIEGSTILAILSGSLVGAAIADRSVTVALIVISGVYLISAGLAGFIQCLPPKQPSYDHILLHFKQLIRQLLLTARAKFAVLGACLFWSVAVVLRLAVVAWAPVVLLLDTSEDIAKLTFFSAIGVAVGAVFAGRLIPMFYLRRVRFPAYFMGFGIVLLAFVDNLWLARMMLFLVGVAGGGVIVPINAVLQDIGHRSIGAGGAVAVQHFFENLAMLSATGLYTLAGIYQVDVVLSLAVIGAIVIVATFLVSLQLPEQPSP